MEGGWIQIPLKADHHGPTSETPLNGVTLACGWWPNIEYWLGSFVIFRGSGPVLLRNPIFFCDFSRRRGSPSGSAHVFSVIKVADQPSNYPQHGFSHWTSTDIKCGSKRLFLLFNIHVEQIENVLEPRTPNPCDQIYPFAYGCSFKSHTSYKNGMLSQGVERLSKCWKRIIIKAHYWLTLYKSVAPYPFTLSCIQCIVLIHLSEQIRYKTSIICV